MFENIPVPPVIEDVVRRRLKSVSGEVRQSAIRTRGILSSFWRCKTHVCFAFGDSSYQSALKANVSRYGNPIPGVVYSLENNNTSAFYIGPETRGNVIAAMSIETEGQPAISFSRGCSFLCYNIGVVIKAGGRQTRFSNQLFFIASLTSEFGIESAAKDLEGILIQLIGHHIKRAPLPHVDN